MANELQLHLRGSMSPETVDEDKRTAEVTFTTGARVRRSTWDEDYDEELSTDPAHVRMDRLNSGAPLLANHDGSDLESVIGVVEAASMEGGKGVARVRFAKDDPKAEGVFNKVKQGVVRNVSVGYRVHKMEKVQGGDGQRPVYRATDWEPFEISAVPMGADAGAGFRSFSQESNAMDETKKQAEETRAAELKAAAEKAVAAERERALAIRSLATKHQLGEEFATKLLADGATIEQARAAVLDELATRSEKTDVQPAHSGISVGREASEKFFRAALATSIQKFGMSDMVEKAQKTAPARVRRYFDDVDLREADHSLMGNLQADFARAFLVQGGHKVGMMENGDSIMKRALLFGGEQLKKRSGGENTTSDYTLLLENLLHKQLLGHYLIADNSWDKFCGVDTVDDFRPGNRYRTGSFAPLSLLNEGDEYRYQNVPDGAKYQVSAQTYGNMIKVSRQALINDDIAGILDTMQKFGRAAALSVEVAVYALLAQNGGLGPSVSFNGNTAPLFDASWANIGASGAGAGTLSTQSIDADRTLLASQKDISGNEYLDLAAPGSLVLLVPLALRGQALNINKSEWDVSQSNKFQVPNIVKDLFKTVVSSPRLSSATRRYIFADPGTAAAIKVTFLNGERAPFMETKLGWTIDGTEMKIRMDYGVGTAEPLAAVTNAGT